MKCKLTTMVAATIATMTLTAEAAITINEGDIFALDPVAVEFGAVRFKDFANGDGPQGNLYLSDRVETLGQNPSSVDGRARVQGSPLWVSGDSAQPFSFEYRPTAGLTDLIVASAANMPSSVSREIDDPTVPVNFISLAIFNRPAPDVATPDSITLNLTDLNGNALSPGSLNLSSSASSTVSSFHWYISDPSLLANGFVLSGSILLSTGVERNENDRIEISFGNTAVPEPSTYLAAALLMLPFGASTLRFIRKRKSA